MEYEYVALTWRTAHANNDDDFRGEKARLYEKGWELERCAPWSQEGMPRRLAGGACIMRRPKDEPRMWTEGELRRFMRETLTPPKWMDEDARRAFVTCQEKELVKSILEDAQTEADMQTAYRKELQRRNEELQAAIDEVAQIARQSGEYRAVPTLQAVQRLLYPLATIKGESNG